MLKDERRRLLGAFVRAHRERLAPPETGTRRRTPGLRREELAARAGISVTWCTWIEQGREVRASPEALKRLALALSLTAAERAYLFELAGRIDPDMEPVPGRDTVMSLRAAVSALRDPAYGLDPLWNACCWNAAAEALFRGWLDGGDRNPNLLRFVFLDPAARRLIPQWEERARRLLAEFRADFGHGFRDPLMQAMVTELAAGSALFAKAWHAQDVQHREGGLRNCLAGKGNVLRFTQHTFQPAGSQDHKLVILLPKEE